MSKSRYIATFLVGGLFLFFAFGSIDLDEEQPTVTTATDDGDDEASDEGPAEAAEAAAIGDEVDMGDSKWTVLEAEDLGDEVAANNEYIDPLTTDGRYIKVHFKVENLTNEEARVFEAPTIQDSQERKFSNVDAQMMYLPDDANTMTLEAIPAGMSREFHGIYELAPNAEDLKFMVRDFEAFNTSYFPVDLGL